MGGHGGLAAARQSPVTRPDWAVVECSVAEARVYPASTGTSRCLWPGSQGSRRDRPRTERGELATGTGAGAAAVLVCRVAMALNGARPGGRRGPAAPGLRPLGICGHTGFNWGLRKDSLSFSTIKPSFV